jgi:predicted GNAT superfamily acetyltransferase
MDDVQIDAVDDPDSCRIAERIQRHAWGMSDRGVVPAEQIRAAVHNGGLLLIARSDGEPVGFCYGFVGLDGHTPILCSHMLAVVPREQSRGVGRALKEAQRRHAAARGFARITWTFDPLQARNAYLNLHRLGAVTRRYLVDHYGPMDDAINAGLPSDRLVAEWDVDADRPAPEAVPGGPWALAAVAGADGAPHPGPLAPEALDGDAALVAVPADIDRLRSSDPTAGPAWRAALRSALSAAFEAGMVAVDLARDVGDDCHAYVLRTQP